MGRVRAAEPERDAERVRHTHAWHARHGEMSKPLCSASRDTTEFAHLLLFDSRHRSSALAGVCWRWLAVRHLHSKLLHAPSARPTFAGLHLLPWAVSPASRAQSSSR